MEESVNSTVLSSKEKSLTESTESVVLEGIISIGSPVEPFRFFIAVFKQTASFRSITKPSLIR
jgi:hypothetical protein